MVLIFLKGARLAASAASDLRIIDCHPNGIGVTVILLKTVTYVTICTERISIRFMSYNFPKKYLGTLFILVSIFLPESLDVQLFFAQYSDMLHSNI